MPSFTQIIPSASPGFLGSNNGVQKRKRNGNAEGGFLSSHGQDLNGTYKTAFPSTGLHHIPSAHEQAVHQMYSTDHGNWVPGEEDIHKRRRCSESSPAGLHLHREKPTRETPNTSTPLTNFQGAPSSNFPPLVPRSPNPRTSNIPFPTHNHIGIKEALAYSTDQIHLLTQMHLPCHICHKKPRYSYELGHFTSCQQCGERTCNICLRECFNGLVDKTTFNRVGGGGDEDVEFEMDYLDNNNENARPTNGYSNGTYHDERNGRSAMGERGSHNGFHFGPRSRHKARICSGCCVEKGEEGEVFCVGCVEEECL